MDKSGGSIDGVVDGVKRLNASEVDEEWWEKEVEVLDFEARVPYNCLLM